MTSPIYQLALAWIPGLGPYYRGKCSCSEWECKKTKDPGDVVTAWQKHFIEEHLQECCTWLVDNGMKQRSPDDLKPDTTSADGDRK